VIAVPSVRRYCIFVGGLAQETWRERDVRVRCTVTVPGPALSALGIIIWAFADLIPLR